MYFDIDGNMLDREGMVTAFGIEDRRIGLDEFVDTRNKADIRVSTVHLVLNHQWDANGAPLIFETMVFGGPHDEWQCRWATKERATQGHRATIAWLLGEGPEPEGDYAMTRAEWEVTR